MRVLTLGFLILAIPTTAVAGEQKNPTPDSSAIRQIVTDMTASWKAGDGEAWGKAFLPDADFMVWFGLHLEGREAISEGHQWIFDRFYAKTIYVMEVQKIRYLGPDVAVVYLTGSVIREGEELPKEPDSVPMAVFQRTPEGWKIAAFQNTPFVVNEYGRNGDLREFKKRVPAARQK